MVQASVKFCNLFEHQECTTALKISMYNFSFILNDPVELAHAGLLVYLRPDVGIPEGLCDVHFCLQGAAGEDPTGLWIFSFCRAVGTSKVAYISPQTAKQTNKQRN